MKPSARYRHIRLLIKAGKYSEALTELLLLIRELKAEGMEVADFHRRRTKLAKEEASRDIGEDLSQLLNSIIAAVRKEKGTEKHPPKSGSIFSRIKDAFLPKRKSSSPPPPKTHKRENLPPAPVQVHEDVHMLEDVAAKEQGEEARDRRPEHTKLEGENPGKDIVNISVFAPEHIQAGGRFLLSAFAYLFEQKEEVIAQAKESDPQASLQAAKSLNLPISRKSLLEFHLSIENWEIEDAAQAIVWFGVPASVEYLIQVPGTYKQPQAFGVLIVKGEGGSLGKIRFNLQLSNSSKDDQTFAPTKSTNIKKACLAYAPADTQKVQAFQEDFLTKGIQSLDPWKMKGDDWQIKVSDAVNEADLYCLFWSKAALDSKEVQLSWQMALGQKLDHPERLPDIIPIALEQPLAKVPTQLSFLDFSSPNPRLKDIPTDHIPQNPGELKQLIEQELMDSSEKAFELLYAHFQESEEWGDKILMLHSRWNSLRRMKRIRQIKEADFQEEEKRIIHATLGIIGQID
ncbi:MAG: TIR domain-containing protein [Bacteroidota bacterium]